MRKFLKYFFIFLILAGVGGYIYWQAYKKKLIKDSISNSVIKGTDSLYVIKYDSSYVNEISGNVGFYNISLQPDSAQKESLIKKDSLPNALFNIRVKSIEALGVDVAGLLKKENLSAKKILINEPFIQIINTGAENPKPFTYKDTLELYRQILGRLRSIKADTILINNANVVVVDSKGKSLITFENINIDLKNFLVDDTKNYESVVSYFIKDVIVDVDNIQLPESKNNTRINLTKLKYNAPAKTLFIDEIQQYNLQNTQPLIDLKNIAVTQLNTDAFILNQQLKAGMISCDGGIATIYRRNQKLQKRKKIIQFSSDVIDEAEIGGVNLGSTKVSIINPENPNTEPFIINNVRFSVTKVSGVSGMSTINEMINSADWQLSAGNISFFTKDKMYKIFTNNIMLNNFKSTVDIGSFSIIPLLSESVFMSKKSYQTDRYDMALKNISLQQVNFNKLINENMLEAGYASLQPIIKAYNDRTLPPDPNSKVGKYPHQLLLKMNFPIYIGKIQVNSGSVTYKEKAEKSKLIGNVFFNNINAAVSNFTNINKRIQSNDKCLLNANALFLGKAKLTTNWMLPLNPSDKNFTVKGTLYSMDATILNKIIEPLAMASVKKGEINKVDFNLSGNDYNAAGNVIFLYNDLGVELLKKEDGNLKTKELASFLANTLVKNNNPRNDVVFKADAEFKRDVHKSFFNLVWKTIFDGVKKTALGKMITK